MTNLFQSGEFILASGEEATWKIDCDALTDDDWETLAWMLMEHLKPFAFVYGVPTGGEPLAAALKKYTDVGASKTLLVDDVWTTGKSMTKHIQTLNGGKGHEWRPQKAVIFARGHVPKDVVVLFKMPLLKESL
jgi:orotate phosphoribosyltransferase